jgi:hypothetical protein
MYDQLTSRNGGFTTGKESNGQEAGWVPEPVLTFRGRKPFSPTGIRSQDRPARTESLYSLSYPVWEGNIRASLWEMHFGREGVDSVRGEDCLERGNEHLLSIKHAALCNSYLLKYCASWIQYVSGSVWGGVVDGRLRCAGCCGVWAGVQFPTSVLWVQVCG